MSPGRLEASEYRKGHFAGYPVHEEIIFRYYALNTHIDPITMSLKFEATLSERNNLKVMHHYEKEFQLAPCNGHQILEWSFVPTTLGKHFYTLDVSAPDGSFTKRTIMVHTAEGFEKMESQEAMGNVIQNDDFSFGIKGLEKSSYELEESIDIGIHVFDLGCGDTFFEVSKSGNSVYRDGLITHSHNLNPKSCGLAKGIPINNPNSERNIPLTEPGEYTISAWFEQFNSTLIHTEKSFVLFDKDITPPLKQFKSGVPTTEIQCKDGFTLLLTPKDSRPVCVTWNTAEKLIPRNWGVVLVSRG